MLLLLPDALCLYKRASFDLSQMLGKGLYAALQHLRQDVLHLHFRHLHD